VAPRQRGFPRVPQSLKRRVGWEEGIGGTTVQSSISTSSSTLVNAALTVLEDGLTLVRTRGRVQFFLSAATAALDGFTGAFGIGVATTAAVTAGAASVPNPLDEQDWDGWIYWRALQLIAPGVISNAASTDTSGIGGFTAVQNIEIDSKAMRKLRVGDSIYGSLQVVENPTAVLEWAIDTRILVKLP